MKSLKILYLSAHPIDANDGPGLHIRAISRELAALGFEVTLAGPCSKAPAIKGVNIEALAINKGRKTRALLAERTKALLSSRNFNWVYTRGSLKAASQAAHNAGLPICVEYNGVLMDEVKDAGWLRKRFYRAEEEAVAEMAELAIAVDQSVATRMSGLYHERGLSEKIEVVENGCEAQAFAHQLAKRETSTNAPSKLVFVGALQPWTRLPLAFAAIKLLPKRFHLSVIGDGPEMKRFQALAKEAEVSVEFLGRLEHAELCQRLPSFDIGINPDAGRDSSPLKVPEYLAAGLAVVSAGPKSLAFIREEGFGEWLEGNPTPESFALAIERISDSARFTQEERLWRSKWACESRSWAKSAKAIATHLSERAQA